MDSRFDFPKLDHYSVEKSKHCVLTTTRRRFSCSHYDSTFTDYDTSDEDFKVFFRPQLFANGDCIQNVGYVSVIFNVDSMMFYHYYFSYIEINCRAAVVDASGKERFMQSFGHVYDKSNSPLHLENDHTFGLGRYVKRETLYGDPSEFIPGDCLTIRVEVDYILRYQSEDSANYEFRKNIVDDGRKIYLSFDSPFGRELCRACDYFRRAADTDMREKETRRVSIPRDEKTAFMHMNTILSGAKDVKIVDTDLYQLYTVAEKYGIGSMMETCRQMINSILRRTGNSIIDEYPLTCIPRILELAETHSDERLKESVAVYLECKEKFKTDVHAFEEHVREELNTDWSCECRAIGSSSVYYKMSRLKSKEPEMEVYI